MGALTFMSTKKLHHEHRLPKTHTNPHNTPMASLPSNTVLVPHHQLTLSNLTEQGPPALMARHEQRSEAWRVVIEGAPVLVAQLRHKHSHQYSSHLVLLMASASGRRVILR